jgi:hypothetical protein
MSTQRLIEWELTEEIGVLGENLSQRNFFFSVHPTWREFWSNPGLRGEKPTVNRLSLCYCLRNNFDPFSGKQAQIWQAWVCTAVSSSPNSLQHTLYLALKLKRVYTEGFVQVEINVTLPVHATRIKISKRNCSRLDDLSRQFTVPCGVKLSTSHPSFFQVRLAKEKITT